MAAGRRANLKCGEQSCKSDDTYWGGKALSESEERTKNVGPMALPRESREKEAEKEIEGTEKGQVGTKNRRPWKEETRIRLLLDPSLMHWVRLKSLSRKKKGWEKKKKSPKNTTR